MIEDASIVPTGTNPSERFVAAHCAGTFLSLWGMANPIGKDAGKELCDFLVVCDPDVVIISVKDIQLRSSEPSLVDAEKWRRTAIDASARQVYGAERFLARVDEVRDRSGRVLRLPPKADRRIHRICVAFGSQGQVGLYMGDLGKGFVHVMDEVSFPIVLRELDTIADLTEYLDAKRTFFDGPRRIVFPGEEDLLAWYLTNNRSFSANHDLIILDDSCWKGLSATAHYRSRKTADRGSYAWDNVINYIGRDLLSQDLLYANPPSESERAVRGLARESRLYRRLLAESLTEVILSGKVRSRMMQSPSGVVYVFLAAERSESREGRVADLAARCMVARDHHRGAGVVIGIATERGDDGKKGLSFDLVMIDKPEWTAADEAEATMLREQLGLFKTPVIESRHFEEYPAEPAE